MKLHYMGNYDLNPESLPHDEHKPNAVPFKEVQSTKELSILGNRIGFTLMVLLAIPAYLRCKEYLDNIQLLLGCIASLCTLFPHEILHALCFKEDVYLYTNWIQDMLFVIGTETMSKSRFVFMCLLPSIVFGFIPYLIGIVYPQLVFFLLLGTFSIGAGAGDYYNAFNALTQMPNGARVYMYKFNSFWYLPE